jgi:hypothetical protein
MLEMWGFVWSDAPFCQHCKAVFVRVMAYTGLARQRRELCVAVFRGVVLLAIGAGLLWFLVIVPLVERPGRVDLYGSKPMRGISAADFTEGVFDLSTLDSMRNFGSVVKLQQEGKLIFVHHNTPVVVLDTQPPRSLVRITEGVYAGKEVWIRTESIRLE